MMDDVHTQDILLQATQVDFAIPAPTFNSPFPDSGEQIRTQRGVIVIEFWILYDVAEVL